MKYNYVDADFDELVEYLTTSDVKNTAGILSHYKSVGNLEMFNKISDAREKANELKKARRREQVGFSWSDLVYYDETSPSCLRWKVDRYLGPNKSVKFASIGDVAGGHNGGRSDTFRFMYRYKTYLAHRIVWELFHGKIAESLQVDHKDGDPLNNKIDNLRIVTQGVNSKNSKKRVDNTSGVSGVYLEEVIKSDDLYKYWVAHHMKQVGVKAKKYFSVKKYGYDEAFRLACEYRAKMIEQLNLQGAEYTERHGT